MKYLIKTDDISQIKGGGQTNYDRIVMDSSNEEVYLIEKPIVYETVDLAYQDQHGIHYMRWMSEPLHNNKGETLYFQWGSTEGHILKEITDGSFSFDAEHYPYGSVGNETWPAYNDDYILPDAYDPVYVHTNGKFRMPTVEELRMLRDISTYTIDGFTAIKKITFRAVNGQELIVPSSLNGSWMLASNQKGDTNLAVSLLALNGPTSLGIFNYLTEINRFDGFIGMGVLNE